MSAEEEGLAARDDMMARAGGALASLDAARAALSEFLLLCVNPDDDEDGDEREEALELALEHAGAATRGIEAAQEAFDDADCEAGEPWDDSVEEKDEVADDKDDEDEKPRRKGKRR